MLRAAILSETESTNLLVTWPAGVKFEFNFKKLFPLILKMTEKVEMFFWTLWLADRRCGLVAARERHRRDQRITKVQMNISTFSIIFEIKEKCFLELNFLINPCGLSDQ